MYATPLKCTVVGDCGVGKTHLLFSYTTGVGTITCDTIPKILGGWAKTITLHQSTYSFGLFDTVGETEMDRLRPLSYPMSDVFLICFDINSPTSFRNVKSRWLPEICHYCPGVPYLIVGTKLDLRAGSLDVEKASDSDRCVTTKEGTDLAKQLDAVAYLECSAFTREGVDRVFNTAIKVGAVQPSPNLDVSKKSCMCRII